MRLFSFILFFLFILLLACQVNAYSVGISPNVLELNKGEFAQITLFNNNAVVVNYTLESDLLNAKNTGHIGVFSEQKIIVQAADPGEELVIINFNFAEINQALSVNVKVSKGRESYEGFAATSLIVIFGILIYLILRKNSSNKS